jgi:hypothetical protein
MPILEKWGGKGANFGKLTIRDMKFIVHIGDDDHHPPGSSRFKELVFQDVTLNFADPISESGPSVPQDVHAGWEGFLRLCERADVVKIREREKERVLGREKWEKAQTINL